MATRKLNTVLTLSLAIGIVLLMSFGIADGLKLHSDTETAMEEMSNMFRSIFPLIPEQTHFFWKTNQLGSTTLQKTTSLKTSRLNSDLSEEASRYSSSMFPWWRLQLNTRKRGPDCMRKCINQGRLHPVQCHSLC